MYDCLTNCWQFLPQYSYPYESHCVQITLDGVLTVQSSQNSPNGGQRRHWGNVCITAPCFTASAVSTIMWKIPIVKLQLCSWYRSKEVAILRSSASKLIFKKNHGTHIVSTSPYPEIVTSSGHTHFNPIWHVNRLRILERRAMRLGIFKYIPVGHIYSGNLIQWQVSSDKYWGAQTERYDPFCCESLQCYNNKMLMHQKVSGKFQDQPTPGSNASASH